MNPTRAKQSVTKYGRVKLPDDDVLEVFRLRLAGATLYSLAARFGIHFMYVQKLLYGEARADAHPDHPLRAACVAAELKKRAASRRRSERLRGAGQAGDAAVRDYRRGYSLRAADARHGLHWVSLGRELARRGVPRRPPGKRSKFTHHAKGAGNG